MKYKAEVMYKSKVVAEYVFTKLSHPNQVVRNVIMRVKNRFSYFIVYVVNDAGEVWRFSVMKHKDGKFFKMVSKKGLEEIEKLDNLYRESKYRWAVDLRDWILEHSTFYRYGEDVSDFSYRQLQQIVREIKKGNKGFQL